MDYIKIKLFNEILEKNNKNQFIDFVKDNIYSSNYLIETLIEKDDLEKIDQIIKINLEMNSKIKYNLYSFIHMSAYKKNTNILKYLFDNFEINDNSYDFFKPLKESNEEIVLFLFEKIKNKNIYASDYLYNLPDRKEYSEKITKVLINNFITSFDSDIDILNKKYEEVVLNSVRNDNIYLLDELLNLNIKINLNSLFTKTLIFNSFETFDFILNKYVNTNEFNVELIHIIDNSIYFYNKNNYYFDTLFDIAENKKLINQDNVSFWVESFCRRIHNFSNRNENVDMFFNKIKKYINSEVLDIVKNKLIFNIQKIEEMEDWVLNKNLKEIINTDQYKSKKRKI